MSIWAAKLTELQSRNRAVVLVTVVETKGSVPREAGTRMLVAATESVVTIGGGHLEFQCMECLLPDESDCDTYLYNVFRKR